MKKAELAALNRDLVLLDQVVEDQESEDANLKKALRTLPQTYEDVSVLAYKVEEIANTNNLNPELEFEKETAADKAGKTSLSFDITTKGGYQDYASFISSLNSLPYNTVVDSIIADNKEGLSIVTTFKVYIRN